ncbi:type I phosphomannose isomerase catalytic subunit [Butyrivibrio sp. AE2032]|uniref:type I phosphomannose isomerase catalytic subunit n=1 Tax=Butyrivibrio sp. AE2032 TaxID=1458463 RepID=UPI00054EDD65|nr:type I phosphomannose isomerase catalytic subunit [Butyrivibrio sp. AE2032]
MKRIPFKLLPAAKDYLWGGSRLNDDFGLNVDISPFAEAWVCSTHSDGESQVPSLSCTLSELLSKEPEILGTHPLQTTQGRPELPILIKLIDAKSDLSVQVHPDDEYAKEHENGSLGKTEMWYVLDAKKDSSLVYGFRRDVDSDEVKRAIGNGSIGPLLNHVPIHKNDLFYIEAGTVHAIGAGALVAEIQESSNLTYRLYDYDRTDKNGNKRELHIDKALDVANLKSSAAPRQPMRTLRYSSGCASELLTRCKYFQVERLLLNTEVCRELVTFQTGVNSFHALLCVDGCGSISWDGEGSSSSLNFFKGDCIFVPAESEVLKLHGRAQILNVSC